MVDLGSAISSGIHAVVQVTCMRVVRQKLFRMGTLRSLHLGPGPKNLTTRTINLTQMTVEGHASRRAFVQIKQGSAQLHIRSSQNCDKHSVTNQNPDKALEEDALCANHFHASLSTCSCFVICPQQSGGEKKSDRVSLTQEESPTCSVFAGLRFMTITSVCWAPRVARAACLVSRFQQTRADPNIGF